MRIDRRTLLTQLGRACAYGLSTPFLVRYAVGSASAQSALTFALRADDGRVFPCSVASGDPSATGVVLWTRLAPELAAEGRPLHFQVALDERFASMVLEGELPPPTSDADFTSKVDLDGRLQLGTRYFYRFVYGDVASRVGRCRTLPAPGAQSLKLALLTCQDYTNGYYGALRHLAADDSVDFVVHLGDFIYETAGDPRFQSLPFADRMIALPSGGRVSLGLADYRHLYRTYRSDPWLQRALEQHTWILSQDDHETANDTYWDYERDTLGAPDHPFVDDVLALRTLKLDAQRAWAEYVPARVERNALATHPHDALRSYRAFQFGDLVNLCMLDTRSYRSAHPCGEGDVFERYLPLGCTGYRDADQIMLGDAQERWLLDQLGSSALWNVLGNQTFFGRLALANHLPVNVDAWDGYEAARRRLCEQLRARNVRNLVVLTGDLHSYMASQVKLDYGNINPLDFQNQLGVEFMTPSLTSSALFDQLVHDVNGDAALAGGLTSSAVFLNNPHIRFFDSARHGYSTIRFARDHCEWVAYAVDKNAGADVAARYPVARFVKHVQFPQLIPRPIFGF